MNNLINIILQAAPAGSAYSTLIMIVLMIVVFYFFMIRPQAKKQKELQKFRNELQKGDKIVTTGGIYGKVAEINDTSIIIEVEDKMRLRIDKAAVLKDSSDLERK